MNEGDIHYHSAEGRVNLLPTKLNNFIVSRRFFVSSLFRKVYIRRNLLTNCWCSFNVYIKKTDVFQEIVNRIEDRSMTEWPRERLYSKITWLHRVFWLRNAVVSSSILTKQEITNSASKFSGTISFCSLDLSFEPLLESPSDRPAEKKHFVMPRS